MGAMTSLDTIKEKVLTRDRLTAEDGLFLFESPELLELAALASSVRTRLHGRTTYYNWNLHLNSTNVCQLPQAYICIYASVPFAAAAARQTDDGRTVDGALFNRAAGVYGSFLGIMGLCRLYLSS